MKTLFTAMAMASVFAVAQAATPVIGGQQAPAEQQNAKRPSTGDASPYVFYTVVTGCSEKRADITYEAGSNGSRQETDDLPWLDFREFRANAFYYVWAQKKSDEDGCELRVTIFLVNLTPDQLQELPKDPNKAITFIILKGGARTVKTATTTLAYGVAEASWTGGDSE